MVENTLHSKLQIKYIGLSKIVMATRNPKEHDLGAIAISVSRHGFVVPLIIDKRTGRLVRGHGGVECLRIMKLRGKKAPDGILVSNVDGDWLVPYIDSFESADDLQAEEYLVADNKTVELGGWDNRVLIDVLSDLAAAGLVDNTGFSGEELDDMIEKLGMDKLDDEEKLEEQEQEDGESEKTVKPEDVSDGDMWQVGG